MSGGKPVCFFGFFLKACGNEHFNSLLFCSCVLLVVENLAGLVPNYSNSEYLDVEYGKAETHGEMMEFELNQLIFTV